MQIYRNKNPYYRTLIFLAASRIAFCVLPVFALIYLLGRIGSEQYLESLVFAVAIFGMVIVYAVLSRHYSILLSGHNGERALFRIIKHIRWSGDCAAFMNLPVMHKMNHSEIDMLLVGRRGIVIIEVKNHSGAIFGSAEDDFWLQKKKFHGGKKAEKKMLNPLIQLRRQRGILKALLSEYGYDVWVENALFFSNSNVKLNLNQCKNTHIFCNKTELIRFINSMKPKKKLTKRECEEIIGLIKRMSGE